jgi:threonine/homoserine/homoserine lactone efflux protein
VSFFVKGLLIGFSIAAPVGPIGLLCIRRTLAEGRISGLVTGLGAATADMLYGWVAGFGLTFVSDFLVQSTRCAGTRFCLRLIGGGFLGFLGIKIFLSRPAGKAATVSGKGLLGAYASTVFLTLANPMTVISFAAIFAGLGVGVTTGSYRAAGVLVLGVFLGSALWWLLLSSGVSLCRGKMDAGGLRWVNRTAGVAIMLFGLWALLQPIAAAVSGSR